MKDLVVGFFYFIFSFLITSWFILESPLYISSHQMILSASIAGGKWLLQILLALFIKKKKSYSFIREIGFVCLVGSIALLPYSFSSVWGFNDHVTFFIVSLVVAVLLMIPFYYRAIKRIGYELRWWFYWLCSLALAITLQITWVFDLFS